MTKRLTKLELEQLKGELIDGKTQNDEGVINPSERVRWAESHPKSVLHSQLEWDDEKLGHEARCQQVRVLLAVHFVDRTDGDTKRTLVVLSSDQHSKGSSGHKGGYRPIDEVKSDIDLLAVLQGDILAELVRLRSKYAEHRAFRAVWSAIDEVEAKLSKASKANDRRPHVTGEHQQATKQTKGRKRKAA